MEFDTARVVFGGSHLEDKKQKTIHIERILHPFVQGLHIPSLQPVLSADDDAGLAHGDLVGRAYGLDDGIALTAGWHVVDEDGL